MIVADVRDALADWAVAAPVSFLVGIGVGMIISTRYRISRRKDGE